MTTSTLSVLPQDPTLHLQHPTPTTIHGRDGVYVRCEACRSLMRFLIVTPNGRQLCRRCHKEGV
jgi:hypothetical protein